MEIVKIKLAVLLLSIISTTLLAQSNLNNAFLESYTLESNKNYEGAIASIKEVAQEDCYECFYRIGWLYYSEARYNEAVVNYTKAQHLMPAATEPLWGLVSVYLKQEKWIELEKVYLNILKIDEQNSKVNYRLGLIYYYRKDYVNALKYFTVTINMFPTDTDVLVMTAWTNYYLNNISAAKYLFNKALLLQPSTVSASEGLKLIN